MRNIVNRYFRGEDEWRERPCYIGEERREGGGGEREEATIPIHLLPDALSSFCINDHHHHVWSFKLLRPVPHSGDDNNRTFQFPPSWPHEPSPAPRVPAIRFGPNTRTSSASRTATRTTRCSTSSPFGRPCRCSARPFLVHLLPTFPSLTVTNHAL